MAVHISFSGGLFPATAHSWLAIWVETVLDVHNDAEFWYLVLETEKFYL